MPCRSWPEAIKNLRLTGSYTLPPVCSPPAKSNLSGRQAGRPFREVWKRLSFNGRRSVRGYALRGSCALPALVKGAAPSHDHIRTTGDKYATVGEQSCKGTLVAGGQTDYPVTVNLFVAGSKISALAVTVSPRPPAMSTRPSRKTVVVCSMRAEMHEAPVVRIRLRRHGRFRRRQYSRTHRWHRLAGDQNVPDW